jgi:hypothetical protein
LFILARTFATTVTTARPAIKLCLHFQQLINDVPFIRSDKRKDFGKSEHVGLPGLGHEAQNYPQHQFTSTG